jgi:hypothetical protein
MDMFPVDSKNIAKVGYDGSEAKLRLQFHNGKTYEYYPVPQDVFQGLMNSHSKGKYAHQNIYPHYKGTQV